MKGVFNGGAALLVAVLAAIAPSPASAAGTQDVNCTPSPSSGFAIISQDATWAQTFTAGRSGKLLTVEARGVARASGGTGGPIDVKLYATSAGTPVEPPLATTQIPAASITADNTIRNYTADFVPAAAPFLTQGTLYAVGLSTPDTAQNSWRAWGDTCPGTVYFDFGATFQQFSFTSGEDFSFATFLGPANDDFARAETLDGESDTAGGTTAGGTREPDEPDHLTTTPDAGLWNGDHSVWYSWRAVESGTTTVDVCTAAIDSVVAVYSLASNGTFADLTQVTDNNNGADDSNCPPGTFGSFATFEAVGATDYRIAVGDAGGARENSFTIALEGQAAESPEITPVAPAPGSKTAKRKPRIKAMITDASPLDDANMTVTVDGRSRNLTYDPATDIVKAKSHRLKPGRHKVEVTAANGTSEAERSWKFRVKRR